MNLAGLLKLVAGLLKLDFLAGYRTYVAAIGLLGLAVYHFSIGQLDLAVTHLFAALAALGIRDAKPEAATPDDPEPADEVPF